MKTLSLSLLLAIVLSVSGCATAGPWRGRVIDTDTRQPIEGAAVVAIWYRSHFGFGGPVERFEDAREAVTDKDGRFTIPAYSYNSVLRDKTKPEFTIFKPGYCAFPVCNVKKDNITNLIASFTRGDGATVELRVLTDDKERRDLMLYRLGNYLVGKDKAPHFYKLYNEESKYLGLGEVK